jgi:hypothetical protein
VPVGASVPGGAVSGVSAKTTPGSTRMRMHTVAMISRIPEGVSRTVRMEEPFVCSINIVIIALKYECFPIHAGEREMAKSRMITHFSGGFGYLGFLSGKGLFLSRKNSPDRPFWLVKAGLDRHWARGTGNRGGGILYPRGNRSITGWL